MFKGLCSSRHWGCGLLPVCTDRGCSTAVVLPPDANVPGIAQMVASEPSKSLDLFVVHGMCHHDKAWATQELERIAQASGGRASEFTGRESSPPGVAVYSRTIELPQGRVRAHALVWSGLTKPLKDRLCYDRAHNRTSCEAPPASDAKVYGYYRDWLNGLAKETLVDDCFSDAVIYLGKSRDAIQSRIQDALVKTRVEAAGVPVVAGYSLFKASQANNDGMVVLSSSLGSKLVFDAIDQMSKSQDQDKQAAGAQLWNSMRGAFMAANQIPLLSLADENRLSSTEAALGPNRVGEYAPDPLASLLSSRQTWNLQGMAGRPSLPIVAFSDPNDLLSFTTRPFLEQLPASEHYRAIDVVVRNAWTLLLFANPLTAHTGYLDNPQVLKVLFHELTIVPKRSRVGSRLVSPQYMVPGFERTFM